MSFSADLWQSITPIYAAILDHPFVRGLTDGSLPRGSFRFYAVQDALYLRDFARALSIAAARAPQDDWIIMFNEHAAGTLKVERALHESFLLATAYSAPFHETVAALLPCYWIYWEVGKALERSGSADPLYARWIGTYASEEFGALVRLVIDCLNEMAARHGASEREAMARHFVTTSRYEWMFWDMGYRKEAWPV